MRNLMDWFKRICVIVLLASIVSVGIGADGCGSSVSDSEGKDDDVTSGSSSSEKPAQVSSHNPDSGATYISITTQLIWAYASRATSYDIYFGTSNPPPYVDNTTATSYDPPGNLSYDTIYYWRIDSKNSAGTTTGNVWWFQTDAEPVTPPAQVGSPNPGDGTTNMSITTQLTWASASGATSYDVYFGTSNPPPFKINTSNTTYDPGTLSPTTTYYWRIDSKNSAGTTTGNVWSFTTGYVWAMVTNGCEHTIAIRVNGTLWAWGNNNHGQLGLGDTSNRYTPNQVGTDTDWATAATGGKPIGSDHYGYTLAIKTDGTLWAWGNNSAGQLGLGDTANRYSPTQLGTDTDWAAVACGRSHTIARKTNNTLWAWGHNGYGQLGLGNTTTRYTPIQVGTDTDWNTIVCGYYHTAAIKTGGTLWVWGHNSDAQLGLGDTANKYSPTQLGTDTNWTAVACGECHASAIKTDGTFWIWGNNDNGQLGLGDTISRTTPTQLGTDIDWALVACGGHHTIAKKTAGTLWAWGRNFEGQLGLGHESNRYTPNQVGTDTDWATVACGYYYTMGRKTDNTLWTWGRNYYGQLGLNDTTDRDSPVKVD